MRKNLVLARVGRQSLHRRWVDSGEARSFDLYLCPFQDIDAQIDLDCTIGRVIPGQKWAGLRHLLNTWDGWRAYDAVWLPDDDILTNASAIDRMFASAKTLDFKLFAPALDERSHYAHYVTMRNRAFFARRTAFVEIMVPGFARETLEELLPTLDLSATGWGWGLDSVWPKLLDYKNIGIIDSVSVRHTRPVGAFRDDAVVKEVLAESQRMMAAHGCQQRMLTFAGLDAAGRTVPLAPEKLLVELVRGWRYLFRDNPRSLRWIVDQQGPTLDLSDYPAAGSPTSPRAGLTLIDDGLALPPLALRSLATSLAK